MRALKGTGCVNIVGVVLETEHGLQATEKERESDGWTRIKIV